MYLQHDIIECESIQGIIYHHNSMAEQRAKNKIF